MKEAFSYEDLEKIVFDKLKIIQKNQSYKGVIQLVELGRIHGVNEHDCYIAALFHDYTKYDSVIEHKNTYLMILLRKII